MSSSNYHKIIRKTIVAFANLFNNIVVIRENNDGTENERFVVPIAYATKEKYFDRVEGDPEANKKIQLTLPRFSYDITGMQFNADRKLNTNNKRFYVDNSGKVLSQYNPVPYDFFFELNLYTRTIEDSAQILETFLPYFTPDYTLKVNLLPEMGIVQEFPIILNSARNDLGYEGAFDSEVRYVYWTFNFTVKGYLFGPVQTPKIIKKTTQNLNIDTNIYTQSPISLHMGVGGFGNYKIGEVVFQGLSYDNATATAIVEDFHHQNLLVTEVEGNFNLNDTVKGLESLASWELEAFDSTPQKVSAIISEVSPNTASINDEYTIITTHINFPE